MIIVGSGSSFIRLLTSLAMLSKPLPLLTVLLTTSATKFGSNAAMSATSVAHVDNIGSAMLGGKLLSSIRGEFGERMVERVEVRNVRAWRREEEEEEASIPWERRVSK